MLGMISLFGIYGQTPAYWYMLRVVRVAKINICIGIL